MEVSPFLAMLHDILVAQGKVISCSHKWQVIVFIEVGYVLRKARSRIKREIMTQPLDSLLPIEAFQR